MLLRAFLLGYLFVCALPAKAQDATISDLDMPVELQTFEGFSDILPIDEFGEARGTKRIARQQEIIPLIRKDIPDMAAYNITRPEQVFCYHVTKKPKDYKGYALDNFALTGYCGELDMDQTATVYEALFSKGQNILTNRANCRIEPRIMLRFVRGVDYTDVLLSAPCPSFTVLYGGKYHAFNIKQNIIEDLIREYEKVNHRFHSPALIKQTIANAAATNSDEEEILEKKQRQQAPIMNWKQQQEAAAEADAEKGEPKKGWGAINLNLRKGAR